MITVQDQTVRVGAFDDLTFQATHRGGRGDDHVLQGKATSKSATDTAGTAAIIAGSAVAHRRRFQCRLNAPGLGIALAGLVTKVVSAGYHSGKPTPDRNNLPNLLSFAANRLPSRRLLGHHSLQSPTGQTLVT